MGNMSKSLLVRQSRLNPFHYETVEVFDGQGLEEVPESSRQHESATDLVSSLTYRARCNDYTQIYFCRSVDSVRFGI